MASMERLHLRVRGLASLSVSGSPASHSGSSSRVVILDGRVRESEREREKGKLKIPSPLFGNLGWGEGLLQGGSSPFPVRSRPFFLGHLWALLASFLVGLGRLLRSADWPG